MSYVGGREDFIERRWITDMPMHVVVQSTVHVTML